jgi:hypothetical protein
MTITNKLYFSSVNASDYQNDKDIGEVCIANISPRERQLRMRFGMVQLAISLVILAVLVALDIDPLWRLPLIFTFGTAAVGYFQAKDKT